MTPQQRAAPVPGPRSHRSRRRVLQRLAAGAGGLLIVAAAGRHGVAAGIAASDDDPDRDDREDDDSGHGQSGHDDSGGDDGGDVEEADEGDNETVAVTGQIPAGSLEVRIVSEDADGFQPPELTIDLGQSVSFVNAHDDEHTATGSGFDTGVIDRGQVVTVAFDEPGVFPYACQFHPVMTGSVGVRGADGVVPQPVAQTGPPPADAVPVTIANLAFDPAQITIPTGATVAWTNNDSVPHTVTATYGTFDSGIFDPGATFSWTFDQPGSFDYLCQLHPQMQGAVTAEGEPTTSGAPPAAPANGSAPTGAEPPDQAVASTAQEAGGGGVSVSIVDFAFEPATLEIAAGATVVWTNAGQAPHTVTGSFADSGALSPGQTFQQTFAEEGTFDYVCAFHPQMTARVQVGADTAGAVPAETTGTTDGRAAGAAQGAGGLSGVWQVSVTPEAGSALPAQQALLTFHADGTLEAAYATAEQAAVSPAWTVRSGHGTWEETATGYTLSVVALLVDEQERYAGLLRMQETGELDAAGETARGSVTFEVSGPAGDVVATGGGTTQGTPLQLDEVLAS